MKEKKKFTDKHEDQNNCEYRIKFINKYFSHKENTYQWIHLKEEDEDNPLLKNSCIEIIHDNQKMREYHIDAHSSFFDGNLFDKRLSIQRNETTRSLMMDKDKSIFK